MEENENVQPVPAIPAEDGDSRPKTEEELSEKSFDESTTMFPVDSPKHGLPGDDVEGPEVDPGNSPPVMWIEDMTADEIDEVANRLNAEHPPTAEGDEV